MSWFRNLAMAAPCIVALACGGSGGEGTGQPASPAASGERITIIFENIQFEDATVFIAFEAAGPRRLGRVTGASSGRFTVRGDGGAFVVLARFLGAPGEYETASIFAVPGDIVTITAHTLGDLTHSIRSNR